MTEDILLQKGFIKKSHPVLNYNFTLNIGRDKYLSISNIGTQDESVMLMQKDGNVVNSDKIYVYKFGYDGYLTELKLNNILSIFNI